MQSCLPTLVGLGLLLCIVGIACFGFSIGMERKFKDLNELRKIHKYGQDDYKTEQLDECDPPFHDRPDDKDKAYVEYQMVWWIQACPGAKWNRTVESVSNEFWTRYHFKLETFPAICSCKKSRMAATVLMAFTGFVQFLIGMLFSIIGCLSPGACCQPRRKYMIFCVFVVLFLLFSFISFVLALHFGMNETDKDVKPNLMKEIYALGRNEIGIEFTAFCGINMFLNLIALILAFAGIMRAKKNMNQAAAAQEQNMEPNDDEGQYQGQGSQEKFSDPVNPSTHSKSQTNSQANLADTAQLQQSSQKSIAR